MTRKDALLAHIQEADDMAHELLDVLAPAERADIERLQKVRRLLREANETAKQLNG